MKRKDMAVLSNDTYQPLPPDAPAIVSTSDGNYIVVIGGVLVLQWTAS